MLFVVINCKLVIKGVVVCGVRKWLFLDVVM